MKESDIQRSILDYLSAKKIWHKRFNTGRRAGVTFGSKGMGDILITYIGSEGITIMWLEVKDKKGKQSQAQKDFQVEVEEQGHRYVVVRSIEDLMEALNA